MLEETLYSVLSPLVAGRVFPDSAPFGTPLPYLTYTQFGGAAVSVLGREVPDVCNGFVQINVWDSTRLAASALMLQIESALRLTQLVQASPIAAARSLHEPDLKLYGASQDFSIWSHS